MKQNRFFLRCIALMAFLAICSLGFAQMPSGFPTMPNTGNPAADAQAYEQAKQEWVNAHPSSNVHNSPVVGPARVDNEAYEAEKIRLSQLPTESQADRAQHQRAALQGYLSQHSDDLKANNVRLLEAYIQALDMSLGQTTVTISAQEYAAFHQELKDLIDANTALFNVTQ